MIGTYYFLSKILGNKELGTENQKHTRGHKKRAHPTYCLLFLDAMVQRIGASNSRGRPKKEPVVHKNVLTLCRLANKNDLQFPSTLIMIER